MARQDKTVKDVLEVLGSSISSIDIRAILIRQRGKTGWDCPFLKITPTLKSQSEVRKAQRETTQKFGKINDRDFKVVLNSRKIDELNSILNDVKKRRAKLKLDKIVVASLVGIPVTNVRNLKVNNSDDFTSGGQLGNSQTIALVLKNVPESLVASLEKYDSYKLKGREFNDLGKILDVTPTALTSEARVVFVFPFDILPLEIGDDKGKLLQKIQIPEFLLRGLECIVAVRGNRENKRTESEAEKFGNSVKIKELSKIKNKAIVVGADIPPVQILESDEIEVTLNHRKLGLIAKHHYSGRELQKGKPSKEMEHSLLEGFKIFRGVQNLGGHINGGNELEQVRGIGNLLSILGFYSTTFRGNDEEIPGENQV